MILSRNPILAQYAELACISSERVNYQIHVKFGEDMKMGFFFYIYVLKSLIIIQLIWIIYASFNTKEICKSFQYSRIVVPLMSDHLSWATIEGSSYVHVYWFSGETILFFRVLLYSCLNINDMQMGSHQYLICYDRLDDIICGQKCLQITASSFQPILLLISCSVCPSMRILHVISNFLQQVKLILCSVLQFSKAPLIPLKDTAVPLKLRCLSFWNRGV